MPVLRLPLLLLPLSALLSLIFWSYFLTERRHDPLGIPVLLDPVLSCLNLSSGASSVRLPIGSLPQNEYILVPSDSPSTERSLSPVSTLPPSCLSVWLLFGTPCSTPPPPSTFTVIYTWVNGSDPLQYTAAFEAAAKAGTPQSNLNRVVGGKWFRDHDELRYSLRSVLDSLDEHLTSVRIITMDYLLSCSAPGHIQGNASEVEIRVAQVPQWLDMAKREQNGEWVDEMTGVGLKVVSHRDIGVMAEVFNSFAIEAGLGGLTGSEGVEENIIYMNDDYFLLHHLMPSTFHTAYYGPVFRMQSDLLVQGKEYGKADRSGEWAALEWSAWLLDERFGARQRPYVIHVSKSMSVPLLAELSLLFSSAFSETRTHAFRSQQDAYTTFLFPHFVIERHREALLWSFIVARLGGEEDQWGEEQMEAAWTALGGDEDAEWYEDFVVKKGARRTLEEGRVANVLGEEPSSTMYRFSSHDGYPYTSPQRASPTWPHYPLPGSSTPAETCTLEFELCLGTDGEVSGSASNVFRRVAFEIPSCGDCIVTALVSASGELGLSAFLPLPPADPSEVLPLPKGYDPHLPLTVTHANVSFSLSSVLPFAPDHVDLHAFSLSLIARYTYVLADTSVRFVSLRSPNTAKTLLSGIDKVDAEEVVAMVCLNDDIVSKEQEVGKVVRDWMGGRWGRSAGWERR